MAKINIFFELILIQMGNRRVRLARFDFGRGVYTKLVEVLPPLGTAPDPD